MVIKQSLNFTANKVLTNTRLLFIRALESRLYLAVHNKTCTRQLISHLTTCPQCEATGGRSITWGSISVSKLVYIIDFF